MRAVVRIGVAGLVATSVLSCKQDQRTSPDLTMIDNSADDARTILQRYVDAWRGEQEMVLNDTVVLGFDISGDDGGNYHVVLSPAGSASLGAGIPETGYNVVLTTEMDFLRQLDRGELNAMTAIGRARMSDPTPLDFRFPPDFPPTAEAQGFLLRLHFHFWNREWPEIIPFGDGMARQIHGGKSAIFYYEQGLRSGWYQVEPGMPINENEEEQTNPFPSLIIVTRGRFQARLEGIEKELTEGFAVLVPAGMTHEFWAEEGQYGEFILVMFGPGA